MESTESFDGDLTDIIKASSANHPAQTPFAAEPRWQLPNNPVTPLDDFGDPFSHLRDPLLPGFFHSSDMIETGGFVGTDNLGREIVDDEMKTPPSIFSRLLLPSSESPAVEAVAAAAAGVSQTGLLKGPPPIFVPNDRRTLISPVKSKGFLVEESKLQISSPRNAGIRRRKNQSKKVVCIPAPSPLCSRSTTGEVVPSDLWAWRKYGQKPIKGSPYPRGYYRCSSSKGCPARKQVERSRTNPNMLVITYTSEHNHPWPTQRNALAGSTRSQPSKTAAKASPKSKNPEEEKKESTTTSAAPSSSHNPAAVKEEADQELDEGFSPSYKPTLPEPNHSGEGFFAGLGEIEDDSYDHSLDMVFAQGFERRDSSKGLDLFSFYDWAESPTEEPPRLTANEKGS